MPQTTCNACGKPIRISEELYDQGAEVYCSAQCTTLPNRSAADDANRGNYAGCEPMGGGIEGYHTTWDDTHDAID